MVDDFFYLGFFAIKRQSRVGLNVDARAIFERFTLNDCVVRMFMSHFFGDWIDAQLNVS